MTDQFPLEPSTNATEGDGPTIDAASRLSNLAPRTPSLSIFTRREPTAAPVDAEAPHPAPEAPPAPDAPFPGLVTSIGRLRHVPAADLWPTPGAMAAWLATTPAALNDGAGIADVTFDTPNGAVLMGSTPGSGPVCVVCEIGPSSDESLGVLLRAAAVQDGGSVVWIVGDPGDAHCAALSWLNRATSPRFTLLRVTGVRIDGSASAPMFEVAVRPPRGSDTAADDGPQRRVEDHLSEG